MIKRAARALIDVKAKLFGVVLNQADLADPRYGQYYYAYQHYGQVYKESQG